MSEDIPGCEVNLQKEINSRIIRIRLMDGTQINGQVNINNGHYNRLSDLLKSSDEPFLILLNATSYHKGLDENVKHKTLFVNKNFIAWASPDESQK